MKRQSKHEENKRKKWQGHATAREDNNPENGCFEESDYVQVKFVGKGKKLS